MCSTIGPRLGQVNQFPKSQKILLLLKCRKFYLTTPITETRRMMITLTVSLVRKVLRVLVELGTCIDLVGIGSSILFLHKENDALSLKCR